MLKVETKTKAHKRTRTGSLHMTGLFTRTWINWKQHVKFEGPNQLSSCEASWTCQREGMVELSGTIIIIIIIIMIMRAARNRNSQPNFDPFSMGLTCEHHTLGFPAAETFESFSSDNLKQYPTCKTCQKTQVYHWLSIFPRCQKKRRNMHQGHSLFLLPSFWSNHICICLHHFTHWKPWSKMNPKLSGKNNSTYICLKGNPSWNSTLINDWARGRWNHISLNQ